MYSKYQFETLKPNTIGHMERVKKIAEKAKKKEKEKE
jgi:hypothetical protein